jgi:hypothetical protein
LGGKVYSVNITPHKTTGIGAWDKATFISTIRARAKLHQNKYTPGDANTIMPYWAFSRMTDEDLGAIFDYLMTLKPVDNAVVRWVANQQ